MPSVSIFRIRLGLAYRTKFSEGVIWQSIHVDHVLGTCI